MASSTLSASCSAEDFEEFCASNESLIHKPASEKVDTNLRKTKNKGQSDIFKKKRVRHILDPTKPHASVEKSGFQSDENESEEMMECEVVKSSKDSVKMQNICNAETGTVEKNATAKKIQNTNKSESSVYYPSNFIGKPFVLVDTSECDLFKNIKIRNGMSLYQHIRHLKIQDIDIIEAVVVTLYKVFFCNPKSANNFVTNNDILKMKLKPFIPRTAFETYGVIRGVALYLSNEEIMRDIKSASKVNFVQRFLRRDPEDSSKFLPTFSVKLGFLGNSLPKDVKLEYTNFQVEHYFPSVRQCYNCGRLGHTQKGCKSSKRCLLCGSTEVCIPPCKISQCILCKGNDHKYSDREKCPVWKKENEINKLKTVKKLSRKEVLNTFFPKSNNRFDVLDVEDTDFPVLVENDNMIDFNEVINRSMTKKKYSSVVKKGAIPKQSSVKPDKVLNKNTKPRVVPVFERQDYQITSQLEKVLWELVKIAKATCVRLNDTETLAQVTKLSSMRDQILANRDVALSKCGSASVDSLDEMSAI
ncbi:uncharacterized protein LOC129250461 [Anastrepha obliqua]|uniref:uncharacterized protein LOC129250461 n=1 Tax=Anastrepha obliqua TaxID=95512 RepID=UPI002409B39E|nr:uncharacterized protein LOC129250461 [Anastrepha obliqua]